MGLAQGGQGSLQHLGVLQHPVPRLRQQGKVWHFARLGLGETGMCDHLNQQTLVVVDEVQRSFFGNQVRHFF